MASRFEQNKAIRTGITDKSKTVHKMVVIANAHNELIHDAVLDYYGKRLATCSSDKTIKIFEVEGETHKLVDTLTGHEGPVWRVDWAHPKFGTILASCSYDGKVLIWKEENGRWSQIAVHAVHSASVNSVQWAPHEYGPLLLVASSDGKVSVVEFKENGTTSPIIIDAHAIGVNSASWAPATVEEDGEHSGAKESRKFVNRWGRQFGKGLEVQLRCANLRPGEYFGRSQ